jgi:hypothetical protein
VLFDTLSKVSPIFKKPSGLFWQKSKVDVKEDLIQGSEIVLAEKVRGLNQNMTYTDLFRPQKKVKDNHENIILSKITATVPYGIHQRKSIEQRRSIYKPAIPRSFPCHLEHSTDNKGAEFIQKHIHVTLIYPHDRNGKTRSERQQRNAAKIP